MSKKRIGLHEGFFSQIKFFYWDELSNDDKSDIIELSKNILLCPI